MRRLRLAPRLNLFQGPRGAQLHPYSTLEISSPPSTHAPDRRHGPLRLAIVGSGPAGFYTAIRVMSRLPDSFVDMYEALPVPFGLVRYGVAPDHPEIKNCQDKFNAVAKSPKFRYIGNVSIGYPGHAAEHCVVKLATLMRHYDSVLMAYGASEDKLLGVPGEATLSGIYSARQLVGWYNGHPNSAGLQPDLTRGEEAIIIGQGNVALDLARIMLARIDVLKKTDITEDALAELAKSRVRRIHVVGRRGPMQAAYTIKEIRELMKLSDVAFDPIDAALLPTNVESLPRASRRLVEVLLQGTHLSITSAPKSWSLKNCLSPKEFLCDVERSCAVAHTQFDVTSLTSPFDSNSQVFTTGAELTLPSSIVIRAIGYKSTPLPGFADAGIQFDNRRNVIIHDGHGRVTRVAPSNDLHPPPENTEHIPGVYCAGWIKRGAAGVIATTMQDGFMTGDVIIKDWLSGARFLRSTDGERPGGWHAVRQETGPSSDFSISWDQWGKIDNAERVRGAKNGKVREKFTTTAGMLSVIT
ncbi:hypothetical protein CDD83_5352 [Cordyceps sp. RAO-2017]|nr:hypothetical protein CDD83_5352 [Cordyceps sp. RAO-2017]